MRRPFLAVMATTLLGTAATAEVWTLSRDAGAVTMTHCAPPGGPGAPGCLMLQCLPGGPYRLHLATPLARVPAEARAILALDGKPALRATFLDYTRTGDPSNFATLIAPDTLFTLMERMGRARAMSLEFDIPALNDPALAAIAMDGFPAAAAAFRTDCAAPAAGSAPPAAPAPGIIPATDPNPATHLARFVNVEDVAIRNSATEAEARRHLATVIAEAEAGAGEPISVIAGVVPFSDGRRLMFASLCHPSYFGITGCETHLLHAPAAEAPLVHRVTWIGGGPFWLDLESGLNGWPDLISQPHTAQGAYVRTPLALPAN